MPTYKYRVDGSGELVALFMSVAEMESRQREDMTITLDDGREAKRDIAAEHGGFRNTPGNWPQLSDAAGCHPDQIQDAMSHARQAGVPTEFTPDGRAKFESRGHRAAYLRAMGMKDREGGYGDG